MQLYPNLTFNGRCEEAFRRYEECLRGKTIFVLTYENSPMSEQTPADWQQKICHSTFALGDWMFSGSDAFPGQYQKP